MGLLKRTMAPFRNVASAAPILIPSYIAGRPALSDGKYRAFAKEAYQSNELVYACIEELATSAAEPTMKARVGKEWVDTHPILELLERPNGFMDRFSFWANVIMYLSLAGNAYALIVRSASGKPVQLWLLRPDRVSVVPDERAFIARYEYDDGRSPVPLPVQDVIHWKHRNPLDDFYGQAPLLAGAGRIDVDNFMKEFVRTFFERAGIPAGMLNIEGSTTEDERREIKERHQRELSGPGGWHGLMVIAGKKATFTQMTKDLGTSGLVVPELDEIAEARICMLMGVPPELVGARVGMQNSSYAQKRSARESFWDETLAPLYQMMAGPLNLRLVPNYPNVRSVAFDLSMIRALQEDEDKVHNRVANTVNKGIMTIEEGRERLNLGPVPSTGTFLLPSNLVPVPASKVGDDSVDLSEVRVGAPGGPNEPVPTPAGG